MAAPATLPSGATPGWRVTNVAASRLMLGSESNAVPEIVLPTVAFMVCNSTLVAVTSMVSLTEPTSKTTFRVEETLT
jgi:hypothetical protein